MSIPKNIQGIGSFGKKNLHITCIQLIKNGILLSIWKSCNLNMFVTWIGGFVEFNDSFKDRILNRILLNKRIFCIF
jgi:hypothetical protein